MKELTAHRGYEEDRRRAQARLVAAWMTNKQSSDNKHRSYVVKNGSDEPVYDGPVTVVLDTTRFASDPKAIFEQDRPEHAIWDFRWLMLPPQETKEVVLSGFWVSPWEAP